MSQPVVPLIETAKRRIVIEQVPVNVPGEFDMTMHFEDIPGGWARVHSILLDALKRVAEEWIKEDRRQRQAGVPHIVIAGNGERL